MSALDDYEAMRREWPRGADKHAVRLSIYDWELDRSRADAMRDELEARIAELEAQLATYKKDDLDAQPLAEAVVRLEAENERLHVCGTCRHMNAEARVCDYIKTDSGGSIHVRVMTQACANMPYVEPHWTPYWETPCTD